VHALLDEIFGLYEREISHNKITLQKMYTKKMIINIDGERIKTALTNIILNAIQAMPDGGKMDVLTHPKRREIIITDTGSGIPRKDLANIFDLFYTTKSTGTGLGLPTAYKIIRAHDGDILIESKENSGTKITIRFEAEN
jgi:signal transduction histidine kinase